MALADLGVLLAAASWIESRSRRWLVATLTIGVLAVGAAVAIWDPTLVRYRGSSGLACACLAFAALDLAVAAPSRGARILGGAVSIALAVKIAVEVRTGAPIFGGTLPPGIRLVPEAHVAGVAAGAMAFVACRALRRRGE